MAGYGFLVGLAFGPRPTLSSAIDYIFFFSSTNTSAYLISGLFL
jgi:hypothetical protein